jgi:hypothetical protein
MSDMNTTQLSDADIERLASKLATFAQTLSAAEQAALGRVIVRAAQAAQAESAVRGYFTLIEMPIALFQVDMLTAALKQAALNDALGDGSVRVDTTGGLLLPAVQTQRGRGGGAG